MIARLRKLAVWFDNDAVNRYEAATESQKDIDWFRAIPFFVMHAGCLLVFIAGWSTFAITAAITLYIIRMFAITAFYHRYFSHKSFKTSRLMQFVFAVLGATAVQRGPLWWAAHHRIHHTTADKEEDQHSPQRHGFIWSHFGWFLSKRNFITHKERISDFTKFPELIFLDRYDTLVPVIYAALLFVAGELLHHFLPGLDTNGFQLLVWGFFISTVFLYHGTFTINSLAHQFGKQVYRTRDDSRNNFWLALITLGEGWHNNHHYFPGSAKQGFVWWEIDLTYYGLLVLKKLGLIWDLKPVPAFVLNKRNIK